MITKITDDFQDFIDTISLTDTQRKEIIDKHTSITTLINDGDYKDIKVIKRRLSGSYAKGTEIKEFGDDNPDVDCIFIVKTNLFGNEAYKRFYDYINDKKSDVAEKVRPQSNSIGILYKNINVDVVIAKESGDGIKIATRDNTEWKESNCLKQIDFMTEMNKSYESFSYLSLMKLFKYLNKNVAFSKIHSYTLEMLIHKYHPKKSVSHTIATAFAETLHKISNTSSIEDIKDCTDSSKKGYDDKDIIIFNNYINEMKEFDKYAQKAVNGERTCWKKIFGDRFPEQPKTKVENSNNYDKTQTPWGN